MKKLTKIGLIGIILAAWTFWCFILGWYKAWEELWKAKFYDASDAMEVWVRNGSTLRNRQKIRPKKRR